MHKKKLSSNNSKKLGCLAKLIIIFIFTAIVIWAWDLYVRVLRGKANTPIKVHLKSQLDFVREFIWLQQHGGSITVQDGVVTDANGEIISATELPPNLRKQFQSQFNTARLRREVKLFAL